MRIVAAITTKGIARAVAGVNWIRWLSSPKRRVESTMSENGSEGKALTTMMAISAMAAIQRVFWKLDGEYELSPRLLLVTLCLHISAKAPTPQANVHDGAVIKSHRERILRFVSASIVHYRVCIRSTSCL